jgi:hypothetical protein
VVHPLYKLIKYFHFFDELADVNAMVIVIVIVT